MENNKRNLRLLQMKKRKTELEFHSFQFSQTHGGGSTGQMPLESCTSSRLSRSYSSRDVFLRQRSSILHDLVMSLGFSTNKSALGRPCKIMVEPWAHRRT